MNSSPTSSQLPADAPPARSWFGRLRLAAAMATVLVVACVGSLLVAEGLVRLIAPQQLVEIRPDIWMPADTVGWINRTNVRTRINTGERTVAVFIDADRFRVDSTGPAAAEQNVLLLGDSFTQALQVEYGDTFGALLESRATTALGLRVRVHNGGVDGWDPPQYLWRLRHELSLRPYDAVIVALYLGNDLVLDPTRIRPAREPVEERTFGWPSPMSRAAIVETWLYPLNDRLERSSQLFVLLKRSAEMLLMRAGLTAAAVPLEILKASAFSTQWEVTADVAQAIAEEALARDVPALFVLISSSYQSDPREFQTFAAGFGLDTAQVDLDQPNALLGAALRGRNLRVIDPLAAFRTLEASGTDLYGRTDRHFSPAGHEVLADAIEPSLIRLLRERGGDRQRPE